MRKIINIIVFTVVICTAYSLVAQIDKDKGKLPKVKPIPVYLGKSDYSLSNIPVSTFNNLMKQGLTSRDSLGKPYKVEGFTFTYAERNLYEDSVGKLMIVTDLLSEHCFGDTFSAFLINNITHRSKAGDTVYFDNISLKSAEGHGAAGRSMRLILTK
jgi:hypothetical protein